MVDIERIRRTAVKRMEQHHVGMLLTCRQVLALIARGDARVAVYEARISELEEEIEQLRMYGDYLEGEATEERGRFVRLTDFAESSGMSVSGLTRLITEGRIRGEKRIAHCGDGQMRSVWFLNEAEATAWMELSQAEKRAIARGELSLMETRAR